MTATLDDAEVTRWRRTSAPVLPNRTDNWRLILGEISDGSALVHDSKEEAFFTTAPATSSLAICLAQMQLNDHVDTFRQARPTTTHPEASKMSFHSSRAEAIQLSSPPP